MNRSLTLKLPQLMLHLTGVISLVLVAGCSDSNGGASTPSSFNPADTLLDEATLVQLNGVWEQRGYGNLYEFENNRTTLYSLTEATCVEITNFEGVAGISPADLEQTLYGLEGDELSLLIAYQNAATKL